MTMKTKGQQQPHFRDDASHHNQSTPSSGYYVNPRIQEIERRMQLRTPDPKSGDDHRQPQHHHHRHHHHRVPPPSNNPSEDDGSIGTKTPDAKRTHHHDGDDNVNRDHPVLQCSSPTALSSILPNSNIKQFESDVLRRRAEYTARKSDLEGRLALFHARLAVECAERGREHAFAMEEHVNAPLERAARRCLERVESDFVGPIMDPKRATAILTGGETTNDDDATIPDENVLRRGETTMTNDDDHGNGGAATANPLPNLVAVERLANLLEARMNHHAHVTLFHSRRANHDAVDETCRRTLQPRLALEMTKADKRERRMARGFESSSGECARLVSEMTSSRVSSLGYVEKEIDDWDISDVTRAEHYLEEIRTLKRRVVEEREERMRQDGLVVEKIVESRKKWHEDILAASDL